MKRFVVVVVVSIGVAAAVALGATSAPSSVAPCRAPEEGDACIDVFQVRTDGKRARLLERNPDLLPSQPVVDLSADLRWIVVTQEFGSLFSARVDGRRAFKLTHGPAGEEAARLSPDGTKVAFQDGRSVWIARSNGRDARKLSGDAAFPAWSPDSRRLVFVANFTDSDDGRLRYRGLITTVAVDGSHARKLSTWDGGQWPPSFAWSPDGRSLAYVTASASTDVYRRDLHIVAIDDARDLAVIPDAAAPTWSADGERIAFVRPARFPSVIAVARRDGTARNDLPATTFVAPSWAPNGRWIAYVGGTGTGTALKRVRPDGAAARTIRTFKSYVHIGRIFWSRDSRRIAYVREVLPHGPGS